MKKLHTEYKDWFHERRMAGNLPVENTPEYSKLIDQEVERCIHGVYVDGVYFHGWMYWHLSHWWIRIDTEDEYGVEKRIESNPEFRDNEWIRMQHFIKCAEKPRKGYIEVGGRQGGKSEMEGSYLGYNAILFEHTQNVIIGGNDGDLTLLKDKVDFGLRKLWKGINIPRIDKTWKTSQVRLGYKTPEGENEVWSYIMIRNAKDGHNTEAAAGTTAKSLIMDEIGKYMFGATYQAVEPAFKGKYGWRGVPMMVGTGGSFTNGADAENFFFNPESNNFLGVDREDGTSGKIGLFLSGLYRQDCKEVKTLAWYMVNVEGKEVSKKSDLHNMVMWVSNKENALEVITKERESLKNNPDRTLYLKSVMYYPLTVDECFLSSQENMFSVQDAKRQKEKLILQKRQGTSVDLVLVDGKVKHEFSDKMPISNFPLKPSDSKEAPVVIYEFPVEDPPYGLYVAGVDPYRQGKSEYSSSLGSVYIYKRMNSLMGEKYQDMFVASYTARPDRKETWEKQARYLIKYYNARTLVENDEISFIDYMVSKGDSHYLEKQPQWLREIVPSTTVNRDFGIHRSASKIRTHLHNLMKDYLEEQLIIEKDEDGKITNEILGVNRVLDPVLLEEIIQFHDDLNTDRLIAAELAIAQAVKMDPILGAIGQKKDPRIEQLFDRAKKNRTQIFGNSRKATFSKRKNNLFR